MLLLSKIPPLNSYKYNFHDTFIELLSASRKVRIATGYISDESVVGLQELIRHNFGEKGFYLELVLGMHYFEGLTKKQLNVINSLNNFLEQHSFGNVRVVNRFKFHGKVYCFYNEKKPFSCLVGSSNLNSITTSHSNYEVDVKIENERFLNNMDKVLNDLNEKATISISQWKNPKILPQPSPLENYDIWNRREEIEIEKINGYDIPRKTDLFFDISLKYEPKSNLNVFFGKGRMSKNKFIVPRPWYEVEIITPVKIAQDPQYPKGEFTLITKEGWKFKCKTTGDYHKNLRSMYDLQVLGRWIKGEMEKSDCLDIGHPITKETIDKFGKSILRLTKTVEPNIWIGELI
jgi:hypothetical protein